MFTSSARKPPAAARIGARAPLQSVRASTVKASAEEDPSVVQGVERKAKQAAARIEAATSDKSTEETGLQDALPDQKQAERIDPLVDDAQAKAAEAKEAGQSILDKLTGFFKRD